MKWFIGILLILALAFGALWLFVSPPGQLNLLDRAWGMFSSQDSTEQIGRDIAFGSHGQRLDVWSLPRQHRGDMFVPQIDTPPAKPVIIFFYGGGWVKGDKESYGWAARALAAEGFVVVVPDYRKVPQVKFPDFVADGADAVRWTQDNITKYGGDPERIVIMGHSAGAHTVAMLTLDPRFLATAGARPDVIKAAVGLSGPYDFYPFTGRAVEAMGAWPRPAETQPMTYVRPDAAPMLLVTGTEDTIVRPKNARNLAKALQVAGGKVTLKEYAGEGHEDIVMALSLPFRGKSEVLEDSVAFIDASLRLKTPIFTK